jgi:hypothetical protein
MFTIPNESEKVNTFPRSLVTQSRKITVYIPGKIFYIKKIIFRGGEFEPCFPGIAFRSTELPQEKATFER